MTILTTSQKLMAYNQAATTWPGSWLEDKLRSLLVDSTIRNFENAVEIDGLKKPGYKAIVHAVMREVEVKGFVLSLIVSVLAGIVVRKLAEWLWDQYVKNTATER